jgi:hypothetical protein
MKDSVTCTRASVAVLCLGLATLAKATKSSCHTSRKKTCLRNGYDISTLRASVAKGSLGAMGGTMRQRGVSSRLGDTCYPKETPREMGQSPPDPAGKSGEKGRKE